jgi:ABC-type sulfate transport system permease component
MIRPIHQLLGLLVTATALLRSVGRRDERGLSQSTENAILLAGAVTVAGLVIAAVTAYVQSRLPQ